MSHTIKLSTAAALAVLALAGVAQAEGVRVTLAGKSPAAIHQDITAAAHAVCTQAVAEDSSAYGGVSECVANTVAAAEEKVATATAGRYAVARLEAQPR